MAVGKPGTLGLAKIDNTWPRLGLERTAVRGETLLGRLVSDGRGWTFDEEHGHTESGSGDPLETLRAKLEALKASYPEAGAIGYLGYEIGLQYLGLPHGSPSVGWETPGLQFLIYASITHPESTRNDPFTFGMSSFTRRQLDDLIERHPIRRSVDRREYYGHVRHIQERISEGNIYQANYTQSFEVESSRSPRENHDAILSRLRAPYLGFLEFAPALVRQLDGTLRQYPAMTILSASPERFWRNRDSRIDARPIKGTIGRGTDGDDDRRRRHTLLTNQKDRAELLMITDLMRNDLGRVAKTGSVRTAALVRVRPTPAVWHLESTVSADLVDGATWVDLMKATFPPGSITGTPKRRAVEILQELERAPRGPYCGAIGWVDAHGDADFAVGIRTCIQIGNRVRVNGGGGIVADSVPEDEYYESLIKMAPLIEALTGDSERMTSLAEEPLASHA